MSIKNLIQANSDYNLILYLSNLRNKKENEGKEEDVIALENEIESILNSHKYAQTFPIVGKLYRCKINGLIQSQEFLQKEVVEVESLLISKQSYVVIKTRTGEMTLPLDLFKLRFKEDL